MKIKTLSCRACGAPKVTPSRSAYLYCDYCGAYLEWDFYRAITAKDSKLPGPEYERLHERLSGKLEARREKGDKEGYRALQRKLFTAHVKACPAAYSPRIGDPAYRSALIEYMVELRSVSHAMTDATAALQWKERSSGEKSQPAHGDNTAEILEVIAQVASMTQVKSSFFWRFFDAYDAFTKQCVVKQAAAGLVETYPDEVEPAQLLTTSYSIFAEAWLPYLAPKDQELLLSRTGLASEYREVAPPSAVKRNCGACGARVTAVKGARCVVCEECGYKLEMARPDAECSNCAATLSIPSGKSHFICPYCQSEVRTLI